MAELDFDMRMQEKSEVDRQMHGRWRALSEEYLACLGMFFLHLSSLFEGSLFLAGRRARQKDVGGCPAVGATNSKYGIRGTNIHEQSRRRREKGRCEPIQSGRDAQAQTERGPSRAEVKGRKGGVRRRRV